MALEGDGSYFDDVIGLKTSGGRSHSSFYDENYEKKTSHQWTKK